MATKPILVSAILDPLRTWGARDSNLAFLQKQLAPHLPSIRIGIVEQFNVGLYSALVSSGGHRFVCLIGAQNVTPGFGYSDATLLREGDEVIFCIMSATSAQGMILAKRPTQTVVDMMHPVQPESETDNERRTHFFSNESFLPKNPAYLIPYLSSNDPSTRRYMSGRPTDLIPGDYALLNQHRCGLLGGLYSMSLVGGGSHIRLFSLENRIRIVADSIIKYTLSGNEQEWHNRRYLSKEKSTCIYQEERLGLTAKQTPAFSEDSDYVEDGYFTKNLKKKQTSRPRSIEQEGYYGGLYTKYYLQPDQSAPRVYGTEYKDIGVTRESVDPSGQYRLATAGMLGLERIGRIPVPVRICNPDQTEAQEPDASKLTPFQHQEGNPGLRQLELADRVAYDLKNSYARVDEAKTEFYTPEESDLKGKLQDTYDPGFTDSSTVKLTPYDRRRSGIWQGEDGSIILRDAWGSEIVMLGGNIQLSCVGNIEILPGKTSLTIAGDDIVQKAQHSIDVEAASNDIHMSALRNIQLLAGVDDDHPGGITLETKGKAGPWKADEVEGGEKLSTTGVLLKSSQGSIVTEAENIILRASKAASIVSGEDGIKDSDGVIHLSAHSVFTYGDVIETVTEEAALLLSKDSSILVGPSVIVAGAESTGIFQGNEVLIPLTWAGTDTDVAQEILGDLEELIEFLTEDEKVALGYSLENLKTMFFKFRDSEECGTEQSWEVGGSGEFSLYEPFWCQVHTKFETLSGIEPTEFQTNVELWNNHHGAPWPGKKALESARYFYLSNGVQNMESDGLNKDRTLVVNTSSIEKGKLFPGYKVQKT